jgi:hypothetical protein
VCPPCNTVWAAISPDCGRDVAIITLRRLRKGQVAQTVEALGVRECVPLFCIGSGTD